MDFWHVKNNKIINNWVMVDFPDVMKQLGVDVFEVKVGKNLIIKE